jgi:hypothetical protein
MVRQATMRGVGAVTGVRSDAVTAASCVDAQMALLDDAFRRFNVVHMFFSDEAL